MLNAMPSLASAVSISWVARGGIKLASFTPARRSCSGTRTFTFSRPSPASSASTITRMYLGAERGDSAAAGEPFSSAASSRAPSSAETLPVATMSRIDRRSSTTIISKTSSYEPQPERRVGMRNRQPRASQAAQDGPGGGQRAAGRDLVDPAGDHKQRQQQQADRKQQQPNDEERERDPDPVCADVERRDQRDHLSPSNSRMASSALISPRRSLSSTSARGGTGSVSTNSREAAMRLSRALMVG